MSNTATASILLAGTLAAAAPAPARALDGKSAAQVETIARYVASHPEMVIDLSTTSGEYCLNTMKVGAAHMVHYAVEPLATREDVVVFVKADAFSGHLDAAALPRAPTTLGAMEPDRWYFLPAGQFDPHHGKPARIDLLVRATDVIIPPDTSSAGNE